MKKLGKYGCSPWGVFSSLSTYGPYATGIPDKIRIIYVPESHPVCVRKLKTAGDYQARAFDPTNGETTELAITQLRDGSSFTIEKPKRIKSNDWAIVIERRK